MTGCCRAAAGATPTDVGAANRGGSQGDDCTTGKISAARSTTDDAHRVAGNRAAGFVGVGDVQSQTIDHSEALGNLRCCVVVADTRLVGIDNACANIIARDSCPSLGTVENIGA